jgi:hypothetical protein
VGMLECQKLTHAEECEHAPCERKFLYTSGSFEAISDLRREIASGDSVEPARNAYLHADITGDLLADPTPWAKLTRYQLVCYNRHGVIPSRLSTLPVNTSSMFKHDDAMLFCLIQVAAMSHMVHCAAHWSRQRCHRHSLSSLYQRHG